MLAYLCQSTNGCDQNLDSLLLTGVVDRKPGNAPMIWGEESPGQGAKFKEIALPTSGRIETAQFIGVSIGPPVEIQPEENASITGGTLTGRGTSDHAAHVPMILPRHRQAVQRYFQRENNEHANHKNRIQL